KDSSGYPVSTPCVNQIFEKIWDNKFGILLFETINLIKEKGWNIEKFWELQVKAEHEMDLFQKEIPIQVICCIDEAHKLLEKYCLLMMTPILFNGGDKFGISQTEKLYLDVHTIDALSNLVSLGVYYDPQRTLDVITSHMTTAIGVSEDRTDILCTYPSDPILVSGALKGMIEIGFEKCLDTLLFVKESIQDLDDLLINMKIDQAEIGFNHWTSLLASSRQYTNQGGRNNPKIEIKEIELKKTKGRDIALCKTIYIQNIKSFSCETEIRNRLFDPRWRTVFS
ncbi:1505_t:CDS:2, partial [Diversispora eburnea]